MHEDRAVAALRSWAVLLDSAFRVPGTRVTFGLDPILGLVPGAGDLATPVFAAIVLLHAVRLRVPRVVQLRMLINAAIDLGIGAIPLAGDLFDVGWKANVRNLALLERHARPGVPARTADRVFVTFVLGVLAVVAVTPMVVVYFVVRAAM